MNNNLMEKIVSLCKRRGFVYPGSEIYGGLANSWDYGPLGVELKNNIKNLWWKNFVQSRKDMVGIDSGIIMNPKVWGASGHLKEFTDPLVECKHCHVRFRADQLGYEIKKSNRGYSWGRGIPPGEKCPNCNKDADFTPPKMFNLMLYTALGPVDPINEIYNAYAKYLHSREEKDLKSIHDLFDRVNKELVYFRPETAQGIFINFKNIMDSARVKLPFGVAQIGKAFRNEITPGNFIFRTREFEQMEIEYFFDAKEGDWNEHFEYWQEEMLKWLDLVGIDRKKVSLTEIPDGERAHYSKRTVDFEYDFPFGKSELYGLAYRGDYDLKNHFKGLESYPHVVEPTFGVERTLLAVLLDSYHEDGDRVVLKLKPALAPYKVAVFPLLANKPELVKKAQEVYSLLATNYSLLPVAWDARGNIGKRYYAQDEAGTPYCVTVDFDSLKDEAVTVRDRDTAKQERVKITELKEWLLKKLR